MKDKKIIILVTMLVALTGLFFSIVFRDEALAKKALFREKIKFTYDLSPVVPGALSPKTQEMCVEEPKLEKTVQKTKEDLEKEEYQNIVGGHPIEVMVDAIAKKDRTVSAFLIGIAKKESDWGKYSPKKDGRECFNYWGYRGGYNPTDSGYSCFDSPEQAVSEVGGRIEKLVSQNLNTPEKMIVWKCGSTCAGHDPESVKKWISDVSLYFYKLNT